MIQARSCVALRHRYRSQRVKTLARVLVCSSAILAGCGVARDAAVTSYHVATAPVRLVARQFEGEPPPATTTSDVDVPGHPVATPSPKPRVAAQNNAGQRSNPNQSMTKKPKSATTSPGATEQAQFPVAKPVPGKPGYVFSPYDTSKYVDVSGYTSGSKVRDPYAQKIFIVP